VVFDDNFTASKSELLKEQKTFGNLTLIGVFLPAPLTYFYFNFDKL
jgi:hypothetical protein